MKLFSVQPFRNELTSISQSLLLSLQKMFLTLKYRQGQLLQALLADLQNMLLGKRSRIGFFHLQSVAFPQIIMAGIHLTLYACTQKYSPPNSHNTSACLFPIYLHSYCSSSIRYERSSLDIPKLKI